MRSHPTALIAIAAGGVAVVQSATSSIWWDPGYGVPIVVADLVTLGAFVVGLRRRRARGEPAARARAGLTAAAVMAAGGACTVWVAVAESRGGSALYPTSYDYFPLGPAMLAPFVAAVAVAAGGYLFEDLAARARSGPRARVQRLVEYVAIAIALALMLRAFWIVPRTNDGMVAVARDARSGTFLLVPAVTLLCLVATVQRRQLRSIPVAAVVVGLLSSAVAGIAIAASWISVLADYMTGP